MENNGNREIVKRVPVFEDKGKFEVVNGDVVEKGTYHVHTCCEQFYSSPRSRAWETQLKVTREGGLVEGDYRKNPHTAYKESGQAYNLRRESFDPKGEKAKMIHEEIVKLVKQNVPAEEIDRRVEKMVDEINPEDE